MSHPQHGHPHPDPAPAGHVHGADAQSPPPDEHDAHPGHGEHLAHVGPGEHTGHDRHAGHDGHDRHAGHGAHGEMFRRRFWVSLVLAIPVVFFSHMVADLLGYTMPDFPGAMWIPPVLGTVIFMAVHHTAAANDPFNWLFVIGALVLAVVFFLPSGIAALPTSLKRLAKGGRHAGS